MTREEEIIEAASEYSEYEFNECAANNGFIKGAQWADKTMIEKACVILSDLGVFDWMADDAQEGFSPEVYKDQFVKCLTKE